MSHTPTNSSSSYNNYHSRNSNNFSSEDGASGLPMAALAQLADESIQSELYNARIETTLESQREEIKALKEMVLRMHDQIACLLQQAKTPNNINSNNNSSELTPILDQRFSQPTALE